MGSFSFFHLIILLSFSSARIEAEFIKSAKGLDLFIRDYSFKSCNIHLRTGMIQTLKLPANFSGIKADTATFRCGSLRRYGAEIKEFHLGIGVILQPCVARVMLIRQNLGLDWSSLYYSNYDLKGYKLVSPILGLLAYNAGSDHLNFRNPFELGIFAGDKPIIIDFRNLTTNFANLGTIRPLCASFGNNGNVTLKKVLQNNLCMVTRNGHYGLVIKSPPVIPPPSGEVMRNKISLWKVVVGSSVGSVLGVFLLGLLLVAMFVKVKRKARMEEMERRAYEEEALQVSMVGHVRAPAASVTRTLPTIEHQYTPYYPS